MEELGPLVVRAQAGDLDAYGEIVRRFQDMAYGYAYAILGDFHLAEDAAQETFFRVLRNLASWDSNRGFEPWLLAIAGNRCRTALASRGRGL